MGRGTRTSRQDRPRSPGPVLPGQAVGTTPPASCGSRGTQRGRRWRIRNLVDREGLAWAGVALDIGAALTRALVAVFFFALFRPIHRWAAAAITAFGLMTSALLMTAAVFSWSALDAALGGAADDAQLLYQLQGTARDVGGIVFGLWLLPVGWLALGTLRMPGLLGWLLLVGGLGYIASTFLHVLLPDATGFADALLIPSTIAELWMIAYLLCRGIAGHLSLVPRAAR